MIWDKWDVVGGWLFTAVAAVLGWAHYRRITELKLAHAQEIAQREAAQALALAEQARKLEQDYLDRRLTKIEIDLDRLNGEGSKRHSEIQTRIGQMEIQLREHLIENRAQMQELARKLRRTTRLRRAEDPDPAEAPVTAEPQPHHPHHA